MIFFYTNPILIAAAVIPAIFLLVHVYRADKLEKEPAPLLISLVLYGVLSSGKYRPSSQLPKRSSRSAMNVAAMPYSTSEISSGAGSFSSLSAR